MIIFLSELTFMSHQVDCAPSGFIIILFIVKYIYIGI